MEGRPGFPGSGTPLPGAPPAADGTVPSAMGSAYPSVMHSPVFADLPAGPSVHLRGSNATTAAAAAGHTSSSVGHLQGKYYQSGLIPDSGYPYLSAYMSGGSPGAYKPSISSSSPSSAAAAAASASAGLHMPHYWSSSAESTSRGYHGYPVGSPHLYSPYYHLPSSSAESIASSYSMGAAKTEGPLPASIRTWNTGLTLSGSPHSSKDSTHGMSGSHILAQIGRKTPTEFTSKSSSRHPSGSGGSNRTVAETKTSPKEPISATSATTTNVQHNKNMKQDVPHGEEAANADGKKGDAAKHSGKKAKVNVPGGDELPKTDNKTDNKVETRTELDKKSNANGSKVASSHVDKNNEISRANSSATSTDTSESLVGKEKPATEKSSSVEKGDESGDAKKDVPQGTPVLLSSSKKPATGVPSVSSPIPSASVPLSISIPAPSANLMPPVSGSNNILVPSAQIVSTSSVTSTPIISPATSAKASKGKHSPKSSKSTKQSSPVAKADIPVSSPQSVESKKTSVTQLPLGPSPEQTKKVTSASPSVVTSTSSQVISIARSTAQTSTLSATATTSSDSSSTSMTKSVTSSPVTGTTTSTTTKPTSDSTSTTTTTSSCSSHQHPHPGFVGHLPIYLHGTGHLTLERESSREVPRNGSKVHATTFVPALGEFIPGPACSAGASGKDGKSRGSSQQKESSSSSGSSKGSSKKDSTKSLVSPKHGSSSAPKASSGDERNVQDSARNEDGARPLDATHHKDVAASSASESSVDNGDKSKKTLSKVGNVTVPAGLEVKVSQYDGMTKEHPMSPSSGSDRDSVPHRTHSTGSDHSVRDHGRMSNPPCFSPPSMHPYSALAGYPLAGPVISPHHLKPHEMSPEEHRRYLEWHYAASAAAKRGYYYEPPTLRLPGQDYLRAEQRLGLSYPSPISDGRTSHPSPRLAVETKTEGGKEEKGCQRGQAPATHGSPPESMLRSVLTAGIHRPPGSIESQRDSSPTTSESKSSKSGSSDEKPYTMLTAKPESESVPGTSMLGTKSSDGRHPPVGIAVAQKRQDSDSAVKGQRSASNSSRSSSESPHILETSSEHRSRSREHPRSGLAHGSERDQRHNPSPRDLPEFAPHTKHHQRHVGKLSSNLVVTGGGSLAPSPRHMSHRDLASTPTPHPHLPSSPHWLPRQPGQHPYWLGSPYGLSHHGPPPPSPLHHSGLDLPGHGHLPVPPPAVLQLARDPATGQLVLIPQSPSPGDMSNLGVWPYLVPPHVQPHSHQLQQLMLNQPSYGHMTLSQHAQLLAGRPDAQHSGSSADFHLAQQQQQEALAHWYRQTEQLQREEGQKREQESQKPLQEKAVHKVESSESKSESCAERKSSEKEPAPHGSTDTKVPLQQGHSSYLSTSGIPISGHQPPLPIVYPPPPAVPYLYDHTGAPPSVYPVPTAGKTTSSEKKEAGTSFSPKSFSPKSSTKTKKSAETSSPENAKPTVDSKTAVKSISIQTSPSETPSDFDDIDVTTVSSPKKSTPPEAVEEEKPKPEKKPIKAPPPSTAVTSTNTTTTPTATTTCTAKMVSSSKTLTTTSTTIATTKTLIPKKTETTSQSTEIKSMASKLCSQSRTSSINIEPAYRERKMSKEEDTISKIIQSVAKTMEKSQRSSESSSRDDSDEKNDGPSILSRSSLGLRNSGLGYCTKRDMDKDDESSQDSASLVIDDRKTESTDLSLEPEDILSDSKTSKCTDLVPSSKTSVTTASKSAMLSRFVGSFCSNSSKESLLSSVLTTSHSMASRMEGLDQDQLAAIEGIALLSEVAEQKAFSAVKRDSKTDTSVSDNTDDTFFRDNNTPLQDNTASAVTCANSALQETIKTLTTSAGACSGTAGHASGSVTPLGSEVLNPSELEMRIKLAEMQRKYTEKKRELDKLQRKDKKYMDKSSKSHHIDKQRGPGRPRKRKFSKDNTNSIKEEESQKTEESQESSSNSVQLGTAVLLEAAASLEEPTPKKKKKEGKEKKKKASKENGEKSSKSKKKKHKSKDGESSSSKSKKSKSKSKSKGSKSKKDASGNIISSKSSKSKSSKSKSLSKSLEPKLGPMSESENNVAKQQQAQTIAMTTKLGLSEIDDVDTDSGSIIWPSSSSSGKSSSKKSKSKKKKNKVKKSKSSSSKSKDKSSSSLGSAAKDVSKDTTLETIESVIRSHMSHSDVEDAVAKMPAPSAPASKPKQGLSIEHVYGDDSDSNFEEDHWSNHKGLALLAALSAQHGSGSSTPVKGSTQSKPKKSIGQGSSKQTDKSGGATAEGSGVETVVKKKSKSKKRSSSKGSTDEPATKKSKKSSSKSSKKDKSGNSKSSKSSKSKKKPKSSALPSTATSASTKTKAPMEVTVKQKKLEGETTTEKQQAAVFDESTWCRRRSERIFLSDTSPIHSRDGSLHIRASDQPKAKKQLSVDIPSTPTSGAKDTTAPKDTSRDSLGEGSSSSSSSKTSLSGVGNIGIVLDALKTDPVQVREKLESMSVKDEEGGQGKKAKKVVKKAASTKPAATDIKITVTPGTPPQQCSPSPPPLVKMESQDSQDASFSEGDNVPLSTLVDKPNTPPPRSCIIKKEELADGLRVLIPIEGRFHAGYVHAIQAPDVFGVIIDGKRSNRPHVFSQEQILEQAIVDVRPGSTRYLPEDTRICAYWSQQFRYLYPGTVVKGTPNPMTDSEFVCVEFDDGDSGRIPLDHIRMLPHDYPIVEFEPSRIILQRKRKRRPSGGSSSADWTSESDGKNGKGGSNQDGEETKDKNKSDQSMDTSFSADGQETRMTEGEDDVFVSSTASRKTYKSKKTSRNKKSLAVKTPKNRTNKAKDSKKKKSADSGKKGGKETTIAKSFKAGEKKFKTKKDSKVKKKKGKDSETDDGSTRKKMTRTVKSAGGKKKSSKKKKKLCTVDVETLYEAPLIGDDQSSSLAESDETRDASSQDGNYVVTNGGDSKESSENGDRSSDKESEESVNGGTGGKGRKRGERLPSTSKMASRQVILDARSSFLPARQLWSWFGKATQRRGTKGKARKVFYKAIMREKELIRVGECAVFLSAGRPHLPYVGRIESMWESWGGNMVVRVKWFYHPEETKGGRRPHDRDMALYQSPHVDENDVQTISHKCEVLSHADFKLYQAGKKRKLQCDESDVYYLAGTYDPTTGHQVPV